MVNKEINYETLAVDMRVLAELPQLAHPVSVKMHQAADEIDRLNWLMEQLLVRCIENGIDMFDVTGITDDELSCPGDVSLGEQMRVIIDQRIALHGMKVVR